MNSDKNQTHNQVQWVTVDEEYTGQRIDNFLIRSLKGVPKSYVYRILRKGEVRVNKGRIKPTYRVQTGDEIRIPPIRHGNKLPPTSKYKPEWLDSSVIYEDKRVIILNKPSGVAVHGGSGIQLGVIELMRQWRDDLHYLELAHRLDRDTSGCLILAKKRSALRQLHEKLRSGGLQKRYLAVLEGNWQYGTKTINAPLQKQVLSSGERMVKVSQSGKVASSTFRPLAVTKKASLVEVEIHTGRTHQIRVHAAFAGHPIGGDDKYGSEAFNQYLAGFGYKRLLLHARGVSFHLDDPETEVTVNASLDNTFDAVLAKLKLNL